MSLNADDGLFRGFVCVADGFMCVCVCVVAGQVVSLQQLQMQHQTHECFIYTTEGVCCCLGEEVGCGFRAMM